MRHENKIVWTPAEEDALSIKASDISKTQSSLSQLQCLTAAQREILPKERQRILNGSHAISNPLTAKLCALKVGYDAESIWTRKSLEAKKREADKAAKAALKKSKTPAKPAPQQKEPVAQDVVVKQDAATPSYEPTIADTLVQAAAEFLERVVVATVKRVLTNSEIASMLRSLQNGAMPDLVVEDRSSYNGAKHNPLPQSEAKGKLPVVLVMGMKPHTWANLQSKFNGRLTLRFWYEEGGKGRNLNSLREKAQGLPLAVATMDQMSHAAVQTVEAVGCRAIRVTGGIESMQTALETAYNRLAPRPPQPDAQAPEIRA